jgi:tRNA pseudouridine32 synthase/23S rRNA pseudouridine746 synthase/23S rRNA pseudouridine1911/1915/1917 synthase
VPAEADGVIDQPLKKITNRTGGWKMAIDPEGQASVTEYRVLGTGDGPSGGRLAWIECHPKTGRTHQIRVHLAAIGAPLLGDPQYGDKTPGERPLHLLSRAVSFKLYPQKPAVSAEAPVPPHMQAALKACGWRSSSTAAVRPTACRVRA